MLSRSNRLACNDNVITACYASTRAGCQKMSEKREMSADARGKAPRESLNIRIRPEDRLLIDRAAGARGKTRTDFILDAARRAAEEALLESTIISVSPEAYADFLARLDAPAQPNERLRRTMQTKAPWDEA